MAAKDSSHKSEAQDGALVLRKFLDEQWAAFLPHLDRFHWPVETARWHELVFCLLHRVGLPELTSDRARRLTEIVVGLNLVDIGELAVLADARGKVHLDTKGAVLLLDVLERAGLRRLQAESAVTTLVEAASAVAHKHGGKIQRYLRRYGQTMLDDLPNQFSFSRLADGDARLAFTLWLQNVLNMPVELWDSEVEEVCRELHASRETLVATADDLDINVALLDDVLSTYVRPDGWTPEGSAEEKPPGKSSAARA